LLPYCRGVDSSPVPILLYHDVNDDPPNVYAVTPSTFAAHMRLVAASGRTPMTVDEYVDALAGIGPTLPPRPVLVTFDDGYRSFPAVVDAMAAASVGAATLYVTTGDADSEGMVLWRDLAMLPDRIQIGAHSRTHPQLDLLPPDRLDDEVRGSKDDVEQRLGRPCRSFAYPHGHHGRRVKSAVAAVGYASAAAVKNALSHARDDPYALARVTITQDTTEGQLGELLAGRGAPIGWSRERLRTKAFRAYRRHVPGGSAHV
jgi:peptidoglycan/xylan/chitin deacetylase (PgdA/CDA1 family)